MPRARKARFHDFEGRNGNERHIRLTDSMLRSAAWHDLKATSIKLYLEIKRRYSGTNQNEICMPYASAAEIIDRKSIRGCLDDLIVHGFIEVQHEGRTSMTANIYKLSARWQDWPRNVQEARTLTPDWRKGKALEEIRKPKPPGKKQISRIPKTECIRIPKTEYDRGKNGVKMDNTYSENGIQKKAGAGLQ